MRLRTQLSLASLALLVLPWTGCQYVREMQGVLRDGQGSAVLATARVISAVLSTRADLFDADAPPESPQDIYAHRVRHPMQLDGHTDDWEGLSAWQVKQNGPGARMTRLAATDGRNLYLLLDVDDPQRRYRNPDGRAGAYDHVLLSVGADEHQRTNYQVAPSGPGFITAERMDLRDTGAHKGRRGEDALPDLPEVPQPSDYALLLSMAREVRIHGVWQEKPSGYSLELALPLDLAGADIGIEAIDADQPGPVSPPPMGRLVYRAPELERLLAGFAGGGYRIWVLDTAGRVIAQSGELDTAGAQEPPLTSRMFYRLLRVDAAATPENRPRQAPRLSGREVRAALVGGRKGRWRLTQQPEGVVLSAAVPLEGLISRLGAVVVEQADRPVAALVDLALARLFGFTFFALLTAAVALFAFASFLSLRIRKLYRASERALTRDGRIRGDFPRSRARDELGDLSRSFAKLLSRLKDSTEYLRSLGSKLSHELRTPLAVVRSSIENLEEEGLNPNAQIYAERAREGADRLSGILSALSAASRIETAIQDADPERFDLRAVIQACLEGYRDVYADRIIQEDLAGGCAESFSGAPDLIAQMLDKLMENAADFSPPGGWIRCRLDCIPGGVRLSVENQGPLLPEHMRERLFDSMVSLRDGGAGNKLHLGLGLYIARLIAEYHGGSLSARNLENGEGVRISAVLKERS